MDDRRAQLLQQREAIARHLAWLDAEIARTAANPAAPFSAPRAPSRDPLDFPPAPSPTVVDSDPDDLIARYASAADRTPPVSKAGCWLIFSVLLTVLLGAGALALYVVYR